MLRRDSTLRFVYPYGIIIHRVHFFFQNVVSVRIKTYICSVYIYAVPFQTCRPGSYLEEILGSPVYVLRNNDNMNNLMHARALSNSNNKNQFYLFILHNATNGYHAHRRELHTH